MRRCNKIKVFLENEQNIFLLMAVLTVLPFYIAIIPFILICIGIIWTKRGNLIAYFKSMSWTGIFILYNIINSALNQNWLGLGVGLVMFLFLVYFKEYQAKITSQTYFKILKVFSLASIPISLLSIVKYLVYAISHGYGVFYIFKYANIQTRATGTFLNANYYGLYCIFSILIAIYMLVKKKDLKNRAWYILAILMNITSIILTAARMLIPTLLISVIVFFLLIDKRLFWTSIALALGVVVVLLIKPELVPRFSKLTYAFADRFKIWEIGWNIFMLNPIFGRGEMAYKKDYFYFSQTPQIHAHQLGLNCLINYGIVGCLILLVILIQYIKKYWPVFKNKKYRLETALILAFAATVFVHGLMDVAIFWLQTGSVCLSVLLLPLELEKNTQKEKSY